MTKRKLVPDVWPTPVVPSRIRKPEWYKGLLVAANVGRDEDGTPRFGKVNADKVIDMQDRRICQLCGYKIAQRDWCVFPGSWTLLKYEEAPLHVECARYSCLVCPNLRNNADKIEFSVCKKYTVVEFEPPNWVDPGCIPLCPPKGSTARTLLSFAHQLIVNNDGETECLTCRSQSLNRMSYREFLMWST